MSRIERSNKPAAHDNFTTPKQANLAKAQGRDEKGRAVSASSSGNVVDVPSPYSSSLSPVPETLVTPPGRKATLIVQTGAPDPEQSPAISSPVPYIPHEEEEEDTLVTSGGGDREVTSESDGVVRQLFQDNADQGEVSSNSVTVGGEPLETPASRRNEKILPLSQALEKARAHFPIDNRLVTLYEDLHNLASDVRSINKYLYQGNYISICKVVDVKRGDKRNKVTYKLEYTHEAKEALSDKSVVGEVFNRRYEGIKDSINKYIKEAKEKIYNLGEVDELSQEIPSKAKGKSKKISPIRVRAQKSPETGKGSGLDEAFQTAKAEYFFYCTAGLVAGKEWCSVTKEGKEITWLDLQRDARVPTKQSIRMDGKAHIGALYSQLSVFPEGKMKFGKQLTTGDIPYHNNRHLEITKSSTPLKALYRVYRFMKKALINRSTFAKGDGFAKIAGAQEASNTRSTTAPGAPVVTKGVFTVDGKNLVDRGVRLDQVNVLVITLRRAIVGVLKAIKNERNHEAEDAKSTLSIATDDTENSVFSDADFRTIEEQYYPETDNDVSKKQLVNESKKASPKHASDDLALNSNDKKKPVSLT